MGCSLCSLPRTSVGKREDRWGAFSARQEAREQAKRLPCGGPRRRCGRWCRLVGFRDDPSQNTLGWFFQILRRGAAFAVLAEQRVSEQGGESRTIAWRQKRFKSSKLEIPVADKTVDDGLAIAL